MRIRILRPLFIASLLVSVFFAPQAYATTFTFDANDRVVAPTQLWPSWFLGLRPNGVGTSWYDFTIQRAVFSFDDQTGIGRLNATAINDVISVDNSPTNLITSSNDDVWTFDIVFRDLIDANGNAVAPGTDIFHQSLLDPSTRFGFQTIEGLLTTNELNPEYQGPRLIVGKAKASDPLFPSILQYNKFGDAGFQYWGLSYWIAPADDPNFHLGDSSITLTGRDPSIPRSVPEPATMGLLGLGALAEVARRRKKSI